MAVLNIYIKNKMSSTANIDEVTSMLEADYNGVGGGKGSNQSTKTKKHRLQGRDKSCVRRRCRGLDVRRSYTGNC